MAVAERVQRLLSGEVLEDPGLPYELGQEHLGLVAVGPGATAAVEEAAQALDRQRLLVEAAGGSVWAWLGSSDGCGSDDVEPLLGWHWPAGAVVAFGEPETGLVGWRLTHRQARAALTVGQAGAGSPVRYRDVVLLATVLRDDLLAASLCQLYLEPLKGERDGGETLRRTLRAYFAAERNVSKAGETIGATRQAVTRRLRTVEDRVGRSIADCGLELEAAMRLDALDDFAG